MHSTTLVIGFDFGYRRIGMAVGNTITKQATPLPTILANQGDPVNWPQLIQCIAKWRPSQLIVGLPTTISGEEQYVTKGARLFAEALREKIKLPVHLVDERLSTVEARTQLFEEGGAKKIRNTEVDSIAACVILTQWLQHPTQLSS